MNLPVLITYDAENNETILLFNDDQEERIKEKPDVYLNHLCVLHGSTMQGREDAYRYLTGYHSKAPVLISERLEFLYFPTLSKKNKMCIWIDESSVMTYHKIDDGNTLVLFSNGRKINVGVNVRIIRNQLLRCEEFRKKLYKSFIQ